MLKQNNMYFRKNKTEKTDTEDKLEDDFCNFDDELLDQTD